MATLKLACLAAGLSSRMGTEHKLKQPVLGSPLIAWACEGLAAFPDCDPFFVLGHEADELSRFIAPFALRTVVNPHYGTGLHSSLRVAAREAEDAEALMICLGDQPFFLKQRIQTMRQSPFHSGTLRRSFALGQPGHPVLIGRDYFSEILNHADGDFGCSYLFKNHAERCECVEQHPSALWDLDRPEDFQRFAAEARRF
jgi:CTP:molybdopterin cytidylyltransferase MocA